MAKSKKKIQIDEFISIVGNYKKRWWLRPVCWLLDHKKVPSVIYGIKYKQCKRCGKDYFNKKPNNVENRLNKLLYKGEIGKLYGVKFDETKAI